MRTVTLYLSLTKERSYATTYRTRLLHLPQQATAYLFSGSAFVDFGSYYVELGVIKG